MSGQKINDMKCKQCGYAHPIGTDCPPQSSLAPARCSASSACGHLTTYYNEEHDNFYCRECHKGMGQEYYNRNIGRVAAKTPGQF